MINSQKPEALYLHGFNLMPQFGPARLFKLINYFESFEQAYHASLSELVESGIEEEIIEAFLKRRANINLDQEAENLEKEDIKLLTYQETGYSKLLLEIPKFPPLLYYRGTLSKEDELCVAVVGTRKITSYGRNVLPFLVEPLIQAGAVVVSGLAYGVDAAAHQLAIDNCRRTVALLGGGLDKKSLYPQNHSLLAEQILEKGGALFSEYPPGTPCLKHHFVSRNRIIAGMCVGTVVVECDLKSGTLITAKYALEQNRQVYAVPGPIYAETSSGPNNLIKMGAKLITNASDILEDLNIKDLPEQQFAQEQFTGSPIESKLLEFISHEPLSINQIIKLSELEAGEVTSTLTFLEMKGKVRNLGGQQYVKSR
jgi:DNA processing protein